MKNVSRLDEIKLTQKRNSMIQRCYNKKNPTYKYYGAKGVTVCQEWLDDKDSFILWSIENGYKDGLTIDKDIGSKELGISPAVYSPETCKYLSKSENAPYRAREKTIKPFREKSTKTMIPTEPTFYKRRRVLKYICEMSEQDVEDKKKNMIRISSIQNPKKPVIHIATGTIYESATATAKHFGTTKGAVGRVCNGKQQTTQGHKFCYVKEIK